MKNWDELEINDKLWLIDKNGELIGTSIYKCEEHIGALPTITYTFDIDDYKYKLVVRIDKDFDTVLYKKLVSNNKETNYDKYLISTSKLDLLKKYYSMLNDKIDKVKQTIKEHNDHLYILINKSDDYAALIYQEKNSDITKL